MGKAGRHALRLGFEGTIKLEFHGAKVSSDAGLFPYRDIDEAAQLTETGAAELFDFRSGSNIQHSTIALLRQSVYSRLAGYEDTNDAERLSVDPVMRHVVGGRPVERNAASISQVARFETEVLTDPDNLAALIAIPGQWVDRVRQRRPLKKLIRSARPTASRKARGTTGTSAARAITRCSCSTRTATWNEPCCVMAMSPAPTTGGRCCCRRSSVTVK